MGRPAPSATLTRVLIVCPNIRRFNGRLGGVEYETYACGLRDPVSVSLTYRLAHRTHTLVGVPSSGMQIIRHRQTGRRVAIELVGKTVDGCVRALAQAALIGQLPAAIAPVLNFANSVTSADPRRSQP